MSIKIQNANVKSIRVTLVNAPDGTPISNTDIFTSDFIIYFATTNAGDMYGPGDSPNNTWQPKAAGEFFRYTAGEGNVVGVDTGAQFNLGTMLLNGTNGDVAIVEYVTTTETVQ
jgi:hypothetical protein